MGCISCCHKMPEESLNILPRKQLSNENFYYITIESSINHRCERCGKFRQKGAKNKCCDDFYSHDKYHNIAKKYFNIKNF